jgi:hypothetical protein
MEDDMATWNVVFRHKVTHNTTVKTVEAGAELTARLTASILFGSYAEQWDCVSVYKVSEREARMLAELIANQNERADREEEEESREYESYATSVRG